MSYPRVILIGGAPMSGKTAVAHMLAATLGYGCLSTDDLGAAIRAVTTKDRVDVAWTGRVFALPGPFHASLSCQGFKRGRF